VQRVLHHGHAGAPRSDERGVVQRDLALPADRGQLAAGEPGGGEALSPSDHAHVGAPGTGEVAVELTAEPGRPTLLTARHVDDDHRTPRRVGEGRTPLTGNGSGLACAPVRSPLVCGRTAWRGVTRGAVEAGTSEDGWDA